MLGAPGFFRKGILACPRPGNSEIFTDLAAISSLLENLSDQASRVHASSYSSSTIHMMPLT